VRIRPVASSHPRGIAAQALRSARRRAAGRASAMPDRKPVSSQPLRASAKALEDPPAPNVGAPVLDPTLGGGVTVRSPCYPTVSACSPGCSSASMSRSVVLQSVFATPAFGLHHHALLMLLCADTRERAARSRERILTRSRCNESGRPGSVRFSWEVVWCVAQGKRSRIAGQGGGRHGNLRAIWACS